MDRNSSEWHVVLLIQHKKQLSPPCRRLICVTVRECMICQILCSLNVNGVKRVLDGDVSSLTRPGCPVREHTCIRQQEMTSIDIEATAHVHSLRG